MTAAAQTPATPDLTQIAAILDQSIVPSTRVDGWNAAKQRRFLEAIADGGTVADACAAVRLSPQSAYAFRRRAAGRAFDLGWRAADLLARERVAADLLARASEGQVVEITRADGATVTKHHYDNRLAVQMLARLDRYADANEATAPGHAARLVAGDFDAYLDLVGGAGGPARAGLFMLARADGSDAASAALEPVLALARADRHLRCGSLAADADLADLDPARRAEWTATQWARAEAAGLLVLAPPPAAPDTAITPQPVSTSAIGPDLDDPVWWDDEARGWRTRFPPRDDFFGEEEGEYGEEGYARELDEAELAIVDAPEAARRADEANERDQWFAALSAAHSREEDDGEPPRSHADLAREAEGESPVAAHAPAIGDTDADPAENQHVGEALRPVTPGATERLPATAAKTATPPAAPQPLAPSAGRTPLATTPFPPSEAEAPRPNLATTPRPFASSDVEAARLDPDATPEPPAPSAVEAPLPTHAIPSPEPAPPALHPRAASTPPAAHPLRPGNVTPPPAVDAA